jgi:type II secretory pathway pseudopilin PulG
MEKIQALKTSGLIGMLSLMIIIGALVFWPWRLDTRSAELVRAKQKAEIVAYQIIQIYKEAQTDFTSEGEEQPVAQKRGLASIKGKPAISAGGLLKEFKNNGTMGVDPWGQPYQYRIIKIETGPRLLVWSKGPNQQLDNQDFLSEDPHEALANPKRGDDIRVLLSIINSDS